MIILIDTREKDLHILRKLEQIRIPYKRQKLCYGDYSFELDGVSYADRIVIERKGSIEEIIGNFTKGRERFRREFERSKGCKVVLMVEASEHDIDARRYRSGIDPRTVKSFIRTWCYKFGLQFAYVGKEDACKFILGTFEKYLRNEGDYEETR
jgi:ERCC4-type nuclease